MPDSIRHQVIDALKAKLEEITESDGYRNTVALVELSARRMDDIAATDLPHIAIIPGAERLTDQIGRVHSTWTVDLVVNATHAKDLTGLTGMELLSDWTNDIRRALYTRATLAVSGLLSVRIVSRQGSEAHPEAADEDRATMVIGLEIEFEEGIDVQ